MINRLTLITGTIQTCEALQTQLQDLIGKYIDITCFAIDDYVPASTTDPLIIFSSRLVEQEATIHTFDGCKTMTALRTINYQYIEKLLDLEAGTKVLCINDTEEMAQETIDTLMESGINHLHYTPHTTGNNAPEDIRIGITPGERAFAPASLEQVIDIGVRLIDITTLIDILDHFHLKQPLGGTISKRYTGKIIDLSRKLTSINKQAARLNQHLQQVVDGVNDGVMAVDAQNIITIFNPLMEKYSGISSTFAKGKHINKIWKNSSIIPFMTASKEESVYLTWNGFNLMVYRIEWDQHDNTLFIFKNADETILMEKAARKELLKTGYIAKYSFDDILGTSEAIREVKHIARKLAKASFPVLIQGESGTGKELFAHAIHQESDRASSPFLAVNFSALPEDLLESELFGYEDGAFTGAKKGGKKGLFEQADGGTLFLDEVGDISPKLQARLLRVIQEKEIRKIGGTKNIPVDVRIIAATNKNLSLLMEKGEFREDLYHRLKVLFLPIPPLRERKADIPILADRFLTESSNKSMTLSKETSEELARHQWFGNVRELKNTIDYLTTVSDGEMITRKDLPASDFFQKPAQNEKTEQSLADKEVTKEILTYLFLCKENYERASRKKVREHMDKRGVPLSDQQIRRFLEHMKAEGWIVSKQGRGGTQITPSGADYLQHIGQML